MRYFAILLIIGLLFASCSKCDNASYSMLALNVSISGDINKTKQAFTDGDEIGLYLVNYSNDNPGVLGNVYNTERINASYMFKSGVWSASGGDEIFVSETFSDLYAYYPYDKEMSRAPAKMNLAAYPFRIQLNQQVSPVDSDFLWSKVQQLSTNNTSADIVFQHLMSRCEINLKFNNLQDLPTDPLLRVYNTKTLCNINLQTGVATSIGEVATIIPERNLNTASGFDFTYNAIIVPQQIPQGTPLLSVTVGNQTIIYQTESVINIIPQSHYTFNMTVGSAVPAVTIIAN